MNPNRIPCIALCSVAFFFSSALFAQIPQNPASNPDSQNPNTQSQTSPVTQDSGQNAGEVGESMKNKMFLRHAAEGGMAEVQLGRLAAQKGGSEEVKAFGQRMVDDHTALNNDMASVADSMGVRLPKTADKDDQAEYDRLSGLSGSEFDTEYITMMIKYHRKDLREFRQEAISVTDPALKTTVEKGQNVIREHLIAAMKLAQAKGVPIPAHGGNRPAASPSM